MSLAEVHGMLKENYLTAEHLQQDERAETRLYTWLKRAFRQCSSEHYDAASGTINIAGLIKVLKSSPEIEKGLELRVGRVAAKLREKDVFDQVVMLLRKG